VEIWRSKGTDLNDPIRHPRPPSIEGLKQTDSRQIMDPPSAPAVTVIIPTYRRPQYLGIALESALGQDFTDFEIIVTDNGREEAVRDLVMSYGDSRCRYRSNETNLGMLGNFRKAGQEARGRYVALLCDDDAWEPELLSSLVPPLDANQAMNVAFTDHYIMNGEGQILEEEGLRISNEFGRTGLAAGEHRPFLSLMVNQTISLGLGSVFRRSAMDWSELVDEAGTAFDLWLTYLLARDGGGAWYVPQRLTRYRVHEQAATVSGNGNEEGGVFCWESFLKDGRLEPYRGTIQTHLARHLEAIARRELLNGHPTRCREVALKALRTRIGKRSLALLTMSFLPMAVTRLWKHHRTRNTRAEK